MVILGRGGRSAAFPRPNEEQYHLVPKGSKSVNSSSQTPSTVDPVVPMCGQGIFNKLLAKKGTDGTGQLRRTKPGANNSSSNVGPMTSQEYSMESSQTSSVSGKDSMDLKWRSAENASEKVEGGGSKEGTAEEKRQESTDGRYLNNGHESFVFDPDGHNTLRAKHRRMMKKKISPGRRHLERPPKMSFDLPSVTEVSSSQEGSSRSRRSPFAAEEQSVSDGSVKVKALLAMRDVVNKQQETLKKLSEQNKEYREKLDESETLLEKLRQNDPKKSNQFDSLRLQKDSYEAEALFLREEMQKIRQELDSLRMSVSPTKPAVQALAANPVSFPTNDTSKDNNDYWKKDWTMSWREDDGMLESNEMPRYATSTASSRSEATSLSSSARMGIAPRLAASSSTSFSRDPSEEKEYLSAVFIAAEIESKYKDDVEQARKVIEAYRSGTLGKAEQEPSITSSELDDQDELKFTVFEDSTPESSLIGTSLEKSVEDDSDQLVLIENMEKVHGKNGIVTLANNKALTSKGVAWSQARSYIPEYQRAFDMEHRETTHPVIKKPVPLRQTSGEFKYQTERVKFAQLPTFVPKRAQSPVLTKVNLDKHERASACSDISDRRDDLATRLKEARLSGITKRMVSAYESRDQTHETREGSPVLSRTSSHSRQSLDSPFLHSDTTVQWGNQSHLRLRNKAITNKALESYKHATGAGKATALFKSNAYKQHVEMFERKREDLRAGNASPAHNPGSLPRPSRGSVQRMLT